MLFGWKQRSVPSFFGLRRQLVEPLVVPAAVVSVETVVVTLVESVVFVAELDAAASVAKNRDCFRVNRIGLVSRMLSKRQHKPQT